VLELMTWRGRVHRELVEAIFPELLDGVDGGIDLGEGGDDP
jgi:hypothetical protein